MLTCDTRDAFVKIFKIFPALVYIKIVFIKEELGQKLDNIPQSLDTKPRESGRNNLYADDYLREE